MGNERKMMKEIEALKAHLNQMNGLLATVIIAAGGEIRVTPLHIAEMNRAQEVTRTDEPNGDYIYHVKRAPVRGAVAQLVKRAGETARKILSGK